MSVRDNDKGYMRIKKNLLKIDRSYTKVGLPQNGKLVSTKGSERVKMSQLVIVGAVHEFGAPNAGKKRNINIPERSFLRSTFDENQQSIKKMQAIVIDRIVKGRMSELDGLKMLGEFMTGKVKQKIIDIKTPKNSKATIKKKTRAGRVGDNPLIDTSQMMQSIQHVEVLR